eukprot:scaffold45_cov337-Pavlova_lutheri.AAC.24
MECCTCTNARDDAAREAWAPAEEKVADRQDGNIDGTWGRGDRARPLSHARFRKERTLRFRIGARGVVHEGLAPIIRAPHRSRVEHIPSLVCERDPHSGLPLLTAANEGIDALPNTA